MLQTLANLTSMAGMRIFSVTLNQFYRYLPGCMRDIIPYKLAKTP